MNDDLPKILAKLYLSTEPCAICGAPISDEEMPSAVVALRKDGLKGAAHGSCYRRKDAPQTSP